MLTRRLAYLFVVAASSSYPPAAAQNAAFFDQMKQSRAAITVTDGKLAGPGADVLRAAMADAQAVLLGEDHGIQQIPQFAAALCTELAPHGFHNLVLEVGPNVAPELGKFARAADGARQLAAFDKKYPETIAFYTWREEFEFLQSCQKAAAPGGMSLWGADQELMGSPVYLLQKILSAKPGPNARAAVEALLQENDQDREAAAKTGSPGDLFLMKAKQEEFERARTLLQKEGNEDAQLLINALITSREIYQKNMSGQGYASNRKRALLMKSNFGRALEDPTNVEGSPPKMLFKFGAWHMYRGINPLHSSEIGNLVSEMAEGYGQKSVHILILGIKGQQLRFSGIGRPYEAVPLDLAGDKDSDFLFLKPFFDNMIEDLWTLYDLRAFRENFNRYGRLDPELERLVFAYDFAVLIPDPKPSHALGEP